MGTGPLACEGRRLQAVITIWRGVRSAVSGRRRRLGASRKRRRAIINPVHPLRLIHISLSGRFFHKSRTTVDPVNYPSRFKTPPTDESGTDFTAFPCCRRRSAHGPRLPYRFPPACGADAGPPVHCAGRRSPGAPLSCLCLGRVCPAHSIGRLIDPRRPGCACFRCRRGRKPPTKQCSGHAAGHRCI